MKRKRIISLALAAAMLLLVSACGSDSSSSGTGSSSSSGEEAGMAVQVQTVEASTISNENKVSGRVTAESQTTVLVGVTAPVEDVYVETGDYVQEGDLICTLDMESTIASYDAAVISRDSARESYNEQSQVFDTQIAQYDDQMKLLEDQRVTLQEQVDMITSQLEMLNTQLAMAEKNVTDTEALLEIGAASQTELDTAKVNADQAKLGVTQAQVSLDQATMALTSNDNDLNSLKLAKLSSEAQKNSTLSQLEAGLKSYESNVSQLESAMENIDGSGNVVAPASGTIMQLNVVDNGMVAPSSPVAIINGVDQLKVVVMVSEALIPKIKTGDEVDVSVSSAELNYVGTIRTIDRSADMQTGLYTVTVSVPPESASLISGMFADVTFRTDTSYDTVVIPSEAILTSNGEQFVYVVEGDRAAKKIVTTGLTGNGVTEVLTGLEAGQTLVTVGQAYLNDGDPVRIVGGN